MWKFLRQRTDDAPEALDLTPQQVWLAKLRDPATRQEALATLTFDDDNVRGPNNELLKAAIEYAADPNPEVRYAAMQLVAHTLRDIEDIRTHLLGCIVRGMTDSSADVRESVSDALGNIEHQNLESLAAYHLQWDEMGALLEQGEADERVLESLSELGASGLLRRLRTDDPELLVRSAELEGFTALARLPTDQPWAWRVAAAIAVRPDPFPMDEPPEESWSIYAALLLPALEDDDVRGDAIEALRELASTEALGPLVVSNNDAFEALMTLPLSEHYPVKEQLAQVRPVDWVNAIWDNIEAWLAENVPELHASLRPGATQRDLFSLEARMARRLDPALSASLARHDGCDLIHAGDTDLTVEDTIEEIGRRMAYVHVLSEVDPEEHDPSVPAVSWHPAWVPIWTRGDGDIQVLDLTTGRVLYVSHDGPAFRAVRAYSYGAWLQQFLDDLREGEYRVSLGTLKTDLPVWPRCD